MCHKLLNGRVPSFTPEGGLPILHVCLHYGYKNKSYSFDSVERLQTKSCCFCFQLLHVLVDPYHSDYNNDCSNTAAEAKVYSGSNETWSTRR